MTKKSSVVWGVLAVSCRSSSFEATIETYFCFLTTRFCLSFLLLCSWTVFCTRKSCLSSCLLKGFEPFTACSCAFASSSSSWNTVLELIIGKSLFFFFFVICLFIRILSWKSASSYSTSAISLWASSSSSAKLVPAKLLVLSLCCCSSLLRFWSSSSWVVSSAANCACPAIAILAVLLLTGFELALSS